MKHYTAVLSGRQVRIEAEQLRQVNDYVNFYVNSEVVAVLRLAPSDSLVETTSNT